MLLKLVVALSLCLPIYSFSLLGSKVPAFIQGTVVDEFANLSVSTGLDILDVQLTDGLGVNIDYGYEMRPSYQKGMFKREDTWIITRKLKAGDILNNLTPIYLNLVKESEVNFIRHFDNRKNAILAKPYTFKNLPTSSEKIKNNLKSNDFVSFSSTLYLALGIKEGIPTDLLNATAKVESLLRGRFKVYIYKIDNRYVRLKLISSASKGYSRGVSVDEGDSLDGISIIKNGLEKIIFLDFFEFYKAKRKNQAYILDYVFDLENPEARRAIDNILAPQFKLSLKDLWHKHQGIKYFEDKLISDFSLAEKLHYDKNGVQRIFKGFNKYDLKQSRGTVSLLVSQFKLGSTLFKNKITFENENGVQKKYFFPNKVTYFREKLRIPGLKRKDEVEVSYHGLVPLDEGSSLSRYSDIGMTYERRDLYLSKLEQKKIKKQLRRTIPEHIFQEIDFSKLNISRSKRNTNISYRILFKENAFEDLKNIKKEEVEDLFYKYAKKSQRTFVGRIYHNVFNFVTGKKISIRRVSGKLHEILTNTDLSAVERVKGLIELQDIKLFKHYGFKILISLLPQDDLVEYIYVDLQVDGNTFGKYRYTFGTTKYSKIYKEVLSMNRQFYRPSEDLRIKGELDIYEK